MWVSSPARSNGNSETGGIALHSITEQIDTTTAAGRFNFRNIADAAEFERDMIKQRTRMGLTALAMEYKWPNATPPIGYTKQPDGRFEIDEGEAEIVKGIFELYLEEQSMPTVAQYLNEEGHRTKHGEKWNARSVRDVLCNRLYEGQYSVGGIEEFVEEYQIVSSDVLDRATDVRYRFQGETEATRPAIVKAKRNVCTPPY